jgi:hypothetical protein
MVKNYLREMKPMQIRAVARFVAETFSYSAETGISPTFVTTGAASGDARKRISASPASGCCTELVSAPANENIGWSSVGMVPT